MTSSFVMAGNMRVSTHFSGSSRSWGSGLADMQLLNGDVDKEATALEYTIF